MGVQGLWQLLQPAGQPVTLESLEGKVLAVDVSIWLHQTMKGMRDKDGHPLPNAHLQGLFSRVCKLLFYRIRPIFVFDGGVPALKKQTMAARRERRAEAERESTEISQKLLRNLMKSQAVRQTLGSERGSGRFVPGIRRGRGQLDSDMFELLPLTESEEIGLVLSAQEWEKDFELQENWIKEGLAVLSDTHPDSEEFRSLPMEIQHEALSEMKEQKKYHSLRRLTKMPEDSTDFSSYQLKKLMQQCKLTTRIEEVRKGMSSATSASLTRSEGDEYFGDEIESRRIVSEDSAHYVLIRGLTKKMQQEEADRYEIHNRVKLEKVEEEEGEDGTSVLEEKGHGSGRFSSDSDNDVESVLPRRLQRRRGQRSKSSRTDTEYSGKLFAEHKRTKVAVSGDGTSRAESTSDITCADSSSSSEDEGFIEIKFDPSAAAVDDDLFPASIFQTQTTKDEGEVKTSSACETLNRERVVHESLDKTEVSGCFKRNRADISPDLQTVRSTEGSDRLSGDITCDTTMSETAADAPPPLSATEDISVKRKSVLNEILSQIEEKKRRLNDSSQIDDCVDIVDVEMGTVSKISSVFVGEDTMGMQKEMAKIESSTSDVRISKPEASFQNHVHRSKRTSADSDLSDSDEDLKIAIELSLQTVRSEDEAASKCYKSFDTAPSQVREDLPGSAVAGEESIVGTVDKSLKESSHSDDQQPKIASSDSDNGGDDFEEVGPDLFITENPSMFKKTGMPVSNCEAGLREVTKGADHEIMPVIGGISDEVDDSESLHTKESYVSKEPERQMKILPDRTQPEDYEDGVGSIFQVMNEDDLEDISTKLESERSALMNERGRHTREAVSVNDQTIQEAQELLRLFGIPFIVSPLEAESQCAYLDLTDQTEGTITDDSDIWLFGGRRTYKNFFNQNKHVEFFTYDNIHKHFGLNRDQLINIALLCGSDYTEGIQGVGSVRALEIMAEFPGDGVEGLRMFRKWWDRAKKQAASVSENRIRAHLKDLKVISGFPSQAVVDAYLHPQVDDSKEKFTWSTPDLNMLRDFAKYKFGWSTEKSDQSLLPMMKQLSKKETQHRIDSYFQPQHLIVASKIKSKRLEKALALVKNLQVPQQGEQADDGVEKADESNQQEMPKRKKRVEDCEEDSRICSVRKVRVHESEEGKVNLGISSVVSVDTAQTENGLTKVQQMVKKDVKRRVADKQKGKLGETARRNKKQTTQKSRAGPCVSKKGKADKGVTQVKGSRVEEKQLLEGKGLLLKNEIEEEASIFHAQSQGHPDMGNESEVNQAKQRSLGKNIKSKEVKGDDHGKRWGKVLVSLDQKHRTRASRPLRSRQDQHRVGRAAMNLSESSSSSDDDGGGDDDESRCAQKITSELGHDYKHQLSTGTEECDHKGETTQLKALKMARIVENKGSQRKNPPRLGYSYKDGHEQQENETSRSPADSQMSAGTRAREKKVKKSPRSNDRAVHRADSVSVIGDQQKVKKTKEQDQHSQKHETALPAGLNFGKSSTEPKQDQRSVTAGHVSDEMLPSVIEKLTKSDQDIQTSQAEKVIGDEDTTVDITKADVSLINKQNLPSTLAYLNHRSREDRLLLQQLRGGRTLNAVEKRLEESKGRLGQEKQKIDRPTRATKPIISFEEILGSLDAESSKTNQGKGRKPPTEIKPAKMKEKPAERSPSRFLHNSGQPGTGMDGPAAESCFSPTDSKQFSEKIPENLKGVCGRSNSTNRSFEQDGARTNFRQTDVIENDLTTFKSSRSKAFDRPIDEMYSDSSDDTHGNGGSGYRGKKKFLKQMEHLGESRSVKGHGPLPLQSARVLITGKAFAGKGKGKGKNRAYLKEALDGGHADVMKSSQAMQDEVNEYALVTEEDLGSDFSD